MRRAEATHVGVRPRSVDHWIVVIAQLIDKSIDCVVGVVENLLDQSFDSVWDGVLGPFPALPSSFVQAEVSWQPA